MIYRDLGIDDLLEIAKEKTLICFGAGQRLKKTCEYYSDKCLFDRIDMIADNDESLRVFSFSGKEKPVKSIDECLNATEKEPIILITIEDCIDVIKQLDKIPELDTCECFISSFLRHYVEPYHLPIDRAKSEPFQIPKIIHYCWFGGSPIRDDFERYIKTWKDLCPDYDIVRWDESNYDYKKNEYMYEAYKQKKWSFVPDYARLDIIFNHGGVYLDTDVEIIRNIDDLLCNTAFCGFENGGRYVANGLGFGATAEFPLIMEQMKIYDSISFYNEDGSQNLITGPMYQTDFMISKGLVPNNSLQTVHGITVYPSDVLSPFAPSTGTRITANTYAIHHYAATWFNINQMKKRNNNIQRYNMISQYFTSSK